MENGWKREWTMGEINRFYAAFGESSAKWLRDLLSASDAALRCDSWARGAWNCNEPDAFSRMTSLAKHIRTGAALATEVRTEKHLPSCVRFSGYAGTEGDCSCGMA